jgi:hypothetical protein
LKGKPLAAACIATLCVILTLGLWPFHAPRNAVAWLPSSNGLRFGGEGTAVSVGEIPLGSQPEAPCSVEIWAQPAQRWTSGALIAFYTSRDGAQFTLRQSLTDLELRHGGARDRPQPAAPGLYVNEVFRSMRPVFLTVSSGPRGTAVYVDGLLARKSPRFRIAAADCSGRLILGTSAVRDEGWPGTLRGAAVYHSEIQPEEAMRHFQTWTRNGRPELAGNEACIALYLFSERRGEWARGQVPAGPELIIPKRFEIQDQAFLEPFWSEFELSRSYGGSVVKNIVGFIPLGFFFYAWLSGKASTRRAAWIATLLGTFVSITIEVLQTYIPTRSSGTTDILTNTFGTWLGVIVAGRLIPLARKGWRGSLHT